ncbi:hypothetical protein SAMN04489806_0464 [Paramicrobacterium humi]|uniref:Tfp pilus assembly protein PilO n=1 Tax=Paramicrobacterium humi TaxID=640635 RepID=A0A1H4J350_9MICO|nr:hypothetical protein [Microbacterium humi]SEB40724.1 hypothetical protein SAMN04489806_0464 [Microbacterium humi]
MDKTKLWILGGAIIMIATLAGGWFVGAQPQLAAIADTEAQTRTIEAQNQATQVAIVQLKGDYDNIDQFRSGLEKLRESIPSDAAMPTFLTHVDALAARAGTTLVGITVDQAQPYTKPQSATPATAAPADPAAPESADGPATASDDSATDPAATDDKDPAPVIASDSRITADNFVAIPISIDVRGSYAQALSFTSALQHGSRLFLVTELSTDENSENPAELDAHISGYAYVLLAQ